MIETDGLLLHTPVVVQCHQPNLSAVESHVKVYVRLMISRVFGSSSVEDYKLFDVT